MEQKFMTPFPAVSEVAFPSFR